MTSAFPEPPGLSDLSTAQPAPTLESVLAAHPQVQVQLRQREDIVILDRIIVEESARGHGLGSAALNDICQFCDGHGLALATTAADAFGGTKAALNKWYQRAGFVPNTGRNKEFRVMEALIRPARSHFDIGV